MTTSLPRIQFATTSDDVRIAYAVAPGDGPPLVMVPGWLSHLEHEWVEPGNREFHDRLARTHNLVVSTIAQEVIPAFA